MYSGGSECESRHSCYLKSNSVLQSFSAARSLVLSNSSSVECCCRSLLLTLSVKHDSSSGNKVAGTCFREGIA